jgi:hypothetical protein
VIARKVMGGDPKMPEFTGLLDGLEEGLVIRWIPKDRFPPSPTVQDVIPGIRKFDAQRSRNELTFPEKLK